MAESVLAAVRVAPSTTELRELPMPELSDDAALLKVEVAGICGTDVKMYAKPPFDDPVIMGHENVGTIAVAGKKFKQLHGVAEGDRVFVEHYVGCYNCEWCRIGEYRHCEATDWRTNPDARRYGYTSSREPRHPVGRVLRVHVPAVERRAAQGAGRRDAPNWPASSRRCRTASSGRCSPRASATPTRCSSRARASRACRRSSPASRPARRRSSSPARRGTRPGWTWRWTSAPTT